MARPSSSFSWVSGKCATSRASSRQRNWCEKEDREKTVHTFIFLFFLKQFLTFSFGLYASQRAVSYFFEDGGCVFEHQLHPEDCALAGVIESSGDFPHRCRSIYDSVHTQILCLRHEEGFSDSFWAIRVGIRFHAWNRFL